MVHRGGDDEDATPLLFTTGAPPATLSIPAFTVRQAPAPGADLRRDVPLPQSRGAARPPNQVNLLATNLSGGLEWYYDPLASGLVGIASAGGVPLPGGTVMLGGRDSHRPAGLDVMREIDLAGTRCARRTSTP